MLKKLWASSWRVPFVCGVFAFLPFLLSLPGGLLGLLLGCAMNEAGTDPCVRFGIPFGDLLYPFTVLPWLAMITFPVGFGGLALWAIWKRLSLLFGATSPSGPDKPASTSGSE
ncbi:MAG: hypothetical protein PHU21_09830 [Elusimicrobia bacterium]|jgi:hypothetical protein|nr:hypothetical protein [Elusimicrobiota bacterium]